MKKKSYVVIVFLMTCIVLSACKKMDLTYEQFVVPGGIIYTAKVVSPVVYGGRNRVRISWPRSIDPTIVKARVFWNFNSDSVEVNVPSSGDSVSVNIDHLPAQPYSFVIKTYDNNGHTSVPTEALGIVYGDIYQAVLLNRPVLSGVMDPITGLVTIQWGIANVNNGGAYAGAIATEVSYLNTSGNQVTKRIGINVVATVLSDFKADGTIYSTRTLYVPPLGIDTFYTDFNNKQISRKLSKSAWTATADSQQLTGLLPAGGPAAYAIDGDINTFWHTTYPSTTVIYPHWLVIDLKSQVNIGVLELVYRQNIFNSFTDFLVDGSLDGINWTTYGAYVFLGVNTPQSFPILGSPKVRYVRIYATKGPTVYAHIAEVSLYGY